MTLLMVLSGAPTSPLAPELSLTDRCDLLATILHAPAKRAAGMKVVAVPFLETDPVRHSATRGGRVVVRAQWRLGRASVAMFQNEDACASGEFILEQNDPGERDAGHDPQGNSDHVVLVTVAPGKTRRAPFTFEERLGLSVHAQSPAGSAGGGFAVPPTKYSGVAQKVEAATWTAKVTRATFAS